MHEGLFEDVSDYCQNCGQNLNITTEQTEIKEAKQDIPDNSLHKTIEKIDDVIFKPKKSSFSLVRILIGIFVAIGVVFVVIFIIALLPQDETSIGTDTAGTNPTATTTTSAFESKSGWQRFISTEHGFAADFPQYPTSERLPEEVLDNGYTYSGIQYSSSPNDNEVYMVQVADYDILPTDFDNKLGLEGTVNGMTDSNTTLTSSSFTAFRGYEAINFTLSTKDGSYAKGLAFIKDDVKYIKLYLMAVFHNTPDFPDFENFINSFNLN